MTPSAQIERVTTRFSRRDRLMLLLGATLVPNADREEWRRNWHAELWHMRERRSRTRHLPGLSAGLLRDALWLRAESWRQAYAGTAVLCLLALTGLCAGAALLGAAACGCMRYWSVVDSRLTRFLVESPLVLIVTFATSSHRYIDQRTSGKTLCWVRRQLFLAAKAALLLTFAFLLSTDLYLSLAARIPITSEVLQVLAFELCAVAGLMWAFRDQDQRCKHCLCALSTPLHVGRRSHNLFEWTGTARACRFGHGVYTIPEMVSSWRRHSQWAGQ